MREPPPPPSFPFKVTLAGSALVALTAINPSDWRKTRVSFAEFHSISSHLPPSPTMRRVQHAPYSKRQFSNTNIQTFYHRNLGLKAPNMLSAHIQKTDCIFLQRPLSLIVAFTTCSDFLCGSLCSGFLLIWTAH